MNKKTENKQKQTEIGRIAVADNQDLVATIVDDEKLDLRLWVKSDSYTGRTKKGLRFYLFDENWVEFKKLIDKIDKAYNEL